MLIKTTLTLEVNYIRLISIEVKCIWLVFELERMKSDELSNAEIENCHFSYYNFKGSSSMEEHVGKNNVIPIKY